MKPSICIEMIYPELPYAERIGKVAEAGFRFIEFWDWRNKNLPELKAACSSCGVQVANFSGQRAGDLIAAETHSIVLRDYLDALEAARVLETRTLMVLANELGEGGAVRTTYAERAKKRKEDDLCKGLRMLLENTPEGMTLLIEPLNTVLDHAGYFLSDMARAVDLVARLEDGRLEILCDLYHQGMMGDDLPGIIEKCIQRIGYFHVADFPGRHEPGTGSADWKRILKAVKETGYAGFVGFEYAPAGDSKESLLRIGELWESL
jgi:hydroxypyruvate isomerase